MSLFKIAWRSIQQRGLASLLTMLSMSLGVMMVVAVLAIHGVVSESFRSNSSLGYGMIVGAKGGKLQLTLNTVYYLSQPVENIPYNYYLEFVPGEKRTKQLREKSIMVAAHEDRAALAEMESLMSGLGLPGPHLAVTQAARQAANQSEFEELGVERPPRFGDPLFLEFAIPVCLGDYFGEYRVVATTPAMFDDLVYDIERGKKFRFAQGRNLQENSQENGYFEAVVGATAARTMNVKVGDRISPSHSAPTDEGGSVHEQKFTVVGILAPSGTPHDRAMFVNMEGFFLMEDHAKPIESEEDLEEQANDGATSTGDTPAEDTPAETAEQSPPSESDTGPRERFPLAIEQREVTAILVKARHPAVTPGIQNQINEGNVAQAVLPIREIFNLFEFFVRPFQFLLLALTATICIVSGVSILVSIYNSMSDRRHEIAVMRALGAKRGTVMSVVLLESIILSLAGGGIGWCMGHAGIAMCSPAIESRTGVPIGFFDTAPRVPLIAPRTIYESSSVDASSAEKTAEENAKTTEGPPLISRWIKLYDTEDNQLRIMLEVTPEALIVPALVLLAVFVGLLPAMAAYRTDVAKSLGT